MAAKSAVQKLIEQYEAEIVKDHASIKSLQSLIDSKCNFIDALRATQKAQAKVKPRKASRNAVAEDEQV